VSFSEIAQLMVNQSASHHIAASPQINSVCPSTFLHCLVTLIQRGRSHFRWEAVRRWSYSLGLQHPEGVHSSSGYAHARSHAPMINVDTLFSPSSSWRRLPTVYSNQGRRVERRQREHRNEVLPPLCQDFKLLVPSDRRL
jgi:hypothetical protein